MTLKPPISAIFELIARFAQPPFHCAITISIPVLAGECPEYEADRHRKWCAANCVGRWQPQQRWTSKAVNIEFENLEDAALFRLSN